ncbi:hypothetical protein V5O48_004561 [Marasmius crinis-equi]|uniref:F-box domain-containing protein n=1 Tax=Marasmius crinis-equi TaxID=585013 RepID=A0ABR3FPY3_9AGAR
MDRSLQLDPRFCLSDYVPSDTEQTHLGEILRRETEGIERYKTEIATLRQRLDMFKRKKKASELTLLICRSTMSLHRRVPTEVWHGIFSALCHPYSLRIDYDGEYPPGVADNDALIIETPALVLSQVCSRWRKIMKGAPNLWSTISVAVEDFCPNINEALETHFTNAKDCLLDIRVIRESYLPLQQRELATWKTLRRHLSRCKHLSYRVKSPKELPRRSDPTFPNLVSFCEEVYAEERQLSFWRAIQNQAPRLTRLILCGTNAIIPSSQLMSLELRDVFHRDIRLLHQMLPLCERLEELSLRGLDDDGVPTSFDEHVQRLDSLRKLCIYGKDPPLTADNQVLSTFLRVTSMPWLTSFEIQCDDWPSSLSMLAERSPLIQSASLTVLAPGTTSLAVYHWFKFLRSFSNVKHVKLHTGNPDPPRYLNWFGDDNLAMGLANLKKGSKLAFPKLESLSLRLSDLTLDTITVEKVLKKVLERCSVSPTLKEFHLFRHTASKRVKGASDERFVLEPALVGKIRGLEQDYGVSVVIGDGDP